MKRHLFLTGPKQVGKSTLIRNYLSTNPCRLSGFLTVKSTDVFTNACSVHILEAGLIAQKKKPSKENFLFFCGKNPDQYYDQYGISNHCAARFDECGVSLLSKIPSETDLIVMDEIGPHEAEASLFSAAILRLLDGSIPILGVLQQAESPLFHAITNHPSVNIITVTEENRDTLDPAANLFNTSTAYLK